MKTFENIALATLLIMELVIFGVGMVLAASELTSNETSLMGMILSLSSAYAFKKTIDYIKK